jgi:hypothetical protein
MRVYWLGEDLDVWEGAPGRPTSLAFDARFFPKRRAVDPSVLNLVKQRSRILQIKILRHRLSVLANRECRKEHNTNFGFPEREDKRHVRHVDNHSAWKTDQIFVHTPILQPRNCFGNRYLWWRASFKRVLPRQGRRGLSALGGAECDYLVLARASN